MVLLLSKLVSGLSPCTRVAFVFLDLTHLQASVTESFGDSAPDFTCPVINPFVAPLRALAALLLARRTSNCERDSCLMSCNISISCNPVHDHKGEQYAVSYTLARCLQQPSMMIHIPSTSADIRFRGAITMALSEAIARGIIVDFARRQAFPSSRQCEHHGVSLVLRIAFSPCRYRADPE